MREKGREKRKINLKRGKVAKRIKLEGGGKLGKGERHKFHGTDGTSRSSSRVEKQHKAVSQVTPIGRQLFPWLLSPYCRYCVALPREKRQRCVSSLCMNVRVWEKRRDNPESLTPCWSSTSLSCNERVFSAAEDVAFLSAFFSVSPYFFPPFINSVRRWRKQITIRSICVCVCVYCPSGFIFHFLLL